MLGERLHSWLCLVVGFKTTVSIAHTVNITLPLEETTHLLRQPLRLALVLRRPVTSIAQFISGFLHLFVTRVPDKSQDAAIVDILG